MANLGLRMNDDLNKLLYLSCKLVVLQNLKACYDYELSTDLPQETRNFRSSCVLDEIKLILDNLVDHVEWIGNVALGNLPCPRGQEEGINRIVADLDKLYTFTLEEAAKKEARLKLMELERSMFKDEA